MRAAYQGQTHYFEIIQSICKWLSTFAWWANPHTRIFTLSFLSKHLTVSYPLSGWTGTTLFPSGLSLLGIPGSHRILNLSTISQSPPTTSEENFGYRKLLNPYCHSWLKHSCWSSRSYCLTTHCHRIYYQNYCSLTSHLVSNDLPLSESNHIVGYWHPCGCPALV